MADINIGYEDIVNTQVCQLYFILVKFGSVHVKSPSKLGDLQGGTSEICFEEFVKSCSVYLHALVVDCFSYLHSNF